MWPSNPSHLLTVALVEWLGSLLHASPPQTWQRAARQLCPSGQSILPSGDSRERSPLALSRSSALGREGYSEGEIKRLTAELLGPLWHVAKNRGAGQECQHRPIVDCPLAQGHQGTSCLHPLWLPEQSYPCPSEGVQFSHLFQPGKKKQLKRCKQEPNQGLGVAGSVEFPLSQAGREKKQRLQQPLGLGDGF